MLSFDSKFSGLGGGFILTDPTDVFLLKICDILRARSFCFYMKVQQDPSTGKQNVNSFFFLIRPPENRWAFLKLRKVLGFGEILIDPKNQSYILFQIRGIDNLHIFLNHIFFFLSLSISKIFKFFNMCFDIIAYKKTIPKNGYNLPEYTNLVSKIDKLVELHRNLYVPTPKALVPGFLLLRMKPIIL